MPSIFGKSHLYRYDIQGSGKRHYLVFVHLPCLFTHFKHFHPNSSLYPHQRNDSSIIECLMDDQSLTRDCLEYVFQRLQIRDRKIFNCFALSFFNKTNRQSYWLDPNLPMRQQLPKSETKPNLTFTYFLYPPDPELVTDEKARIILQEQIFCNFISSVYTLSMNSAVALCSLFVRACFTDEFHPEKNRDILRTILHSIGQPEELFQKVFEFYRDLKNVDGKSAQNQFVNEISQLNTYGMIHLECKNTLNETVCLGLNYQGLHSRSLIHQHFKLEASWSSISSISSNKSRQINVNIKPTGDQRRTLIYYTDSTNYNRYCRRLLEIFFENYRSFSLPSTKTKRIPSLNLALSVPDLRSDGETSSNDRTPSSTRSSIRSQNLWTGSLPNLTGENAIDLKAKEKVRSKNDPYGTFSEKLDSIGQKVGRRSLPVSQQSQSSISAQIKLIHSSFSKISLHNLSPCFSCECLIEREVQGSIRHSSSNSSTLTSQSRSLLNSRTFLSSTSVPLESEAISVDDDTTTDTWLSEFESKISNNTIYDEFESISVSRLNSSSDDGRLPENTRRNRYIDVIPYDDTRVRLIPSKDNLHGYINASHIKIRVENTIYSYIAAEAPLPLTVQDFWRMISGSNVHVVVMLLPSDPQLCGNYFPRSKNDVFRTEEFQVELISEQNRDHFHVRHLKMKFLNGQRTRTLVHLQYTSWDETQLPSDSLKFIEFVNLANSFRRHFGETNPCLVHCTAGIGRTGIFILIHVMIQCITFNKKVSVGSVLKVMREHRMSMVDRTYSYVFVYRCLIDYLKSSRLI